MENDGRFDLSGASQGGLRSADDLRRRVINPEASWLIKALITYSGGLIKTAKQAMYVLWVFVVVGIVVSLVLMVGGRGGPDIPLPKGAKIIYPPNEPPRLERPLNQ